MRAHACISSVGTSSILISPHRIVTFNLGTRLSEFPLAVRISHGYALFLLDMLVFDG